jgi:hypothetical protein
MSFAHVPLAYAREAVEHYTLPPTLLSWTEIDPLNSKDPHAWWKPWEFLRVFFESKGYFLFQPGGRAGNLSVPMAHESGCITPPAQDSFGLYGNREGYKSTFWRVSCLVVLFFGSETELLSAGAPVSLRRTG